jgi:hypothetical protein
MTIIFLIALITLLVLVGVLSWCCLWVSKRSEEENDNINFRRLFRGE